MSRNHICVKLARQANPAALSAKLEPSLSGSTATERLVDLHSSSAALEIFNTKTLPLPLRDVIWQLFSVNMQAYYEASRSGWQSSEKKKELFHAESRFIVLRRQGPRQSTTPWTSADLLGFAIIRFDTEETAGDDMCDVLYCYELQVSPSARRQGVGAALVRVCEQMGRDWRMDKVMLTVFKHNRDAQAFYDKMGYETDEIDPSRCVDAEGGVEEVDYRIMSRSVNR